MGGAYDALSSGGTPASTVAVSDVTDSVMVVSDGRSFESLAVTSLLQAAAAAAHALSSCHMERRRPLASNAARSWGQTFRKNKRGLKRARKRETWTKANRF